MTEKSDFTQRTQQKLRYARIHLDELKSMPKSLGRGSEYERAHHEAFISQLFGAYDAFLIELNQYLGCGLAKDNISLGKLRNKLKDKGNSSKVLTDLYKLSKDSASWFCIAKDMRDLSTHVSGIPLAHYAHIGGGGGSDKTQLKHPITMKEYEKDAFEAFETWLAEMWELIKKYRTMALTEAG